MSLETKYNTRSPGVKRLMREAMELANPTEEYFANPLDDNLFEWHFTVRGPPSTEFEGGYYHGRILLPTQYPMQPPNIILLTPNGRFEVNKKICLSISGYHPESWQPSWSIRTALLALIAFMPTAAGGTIGSLDYTPEERKTLAKKSLGWECPTCGNISSKLLSAPPTSNLTQEESSMIQQIALKAEEEPNRRNVEVDKSGEDVIKKSCDSSSGDINSAQMPQNSDLRQRSAESCNVSNPVNVTDSLLQASIDSVNRDRFWSSVIWVIVAMIVLLIIRRLFLI